MPKKEYTEEERNVILSEVNDELNYDRNLSNERAGEIVFSMAHLYADYDDDKESPYNEALSDQMNKMFRGRMGSSILTDDAWNELSIFNEAVIEYVTEIKLEAGEKIDAFKEQIRKGEIEGTKDLYDENDPDMENKVSVLANALFLQQEPELAKKLKGADLLFEHYQHELRNHRYTQEVKTGTFTPEGKEIKKNETKPCSEWLREDSRKTYDDLIENKFKKYSDKKDEYIGIRYSDLKSQDAFGFKLNPDYKPGEPAFSEVPENRLVRQAREAKQEAQRRRDADQEKLGNYHSKLNKSMNDLEEYQRQALSIAAEAKGMLRELKAMKKKSGDNSESYEELRKSLLSLSRLGTGKNLTPEELAMSVDPKRVERSIGRVAAASKQYIKEHRGPFSGNGNVGIQRRDLALRAQTFANRSSQKLDLNKYDITKEKLTVQAQKISVRLDQVEALNAERGFRKLPKRGMTPDEVGRRLDLSIEEARRADNDVHLGSGEYVDAVRSAKTVAEQLKSFEALSKDPKVKGAELEKARKKLDKTIRTADQFAKTYLDKKKKEGTPLSGMNHDERVQRRIDAIEDCQYAVKLARMSMNNIVYEIQSSRFSERDLKKQQQLDDDERLWQELSRGSSFDPASVNRQQFNTNVNDLADNANISNSDTEQTGGNADTTNIDARRSEFEPDINRPAANEVNNNIVTKKEAEREKEEKTEAQKEAENEIKQEEAVPGLNSARRPDAGNHTKANRAVIDDPAFKIQYELAEQNSHLKQTSYLADLSATRLNKMLDPNSGVKYSKESAYRCMASIIYNDMVAKHFDQKYTKAGSSVKTQELKNLIAGIAANPQFRRIVGKGDPESVKKFLENPTIAKNAFVNFCVSSKKQRANANEIKTEYQKNRIKKKDLQKNQPVIQ